MPKLFRITIAKEVCVEVEVEANSEAEARTKALTVADDWKWCDGHEPFEIVESKDITPDDD
jgi:hypothetical protein